MTAAKETAYKETAYGAAWALGGLAMSRWIRPDLPLRSLATIGGLGCVTALSTVAMQGEKDHWARHIALTSSGALSCAFLGSAIQIFQIQIPNLISACQAKEWMAGIGAVRLLTFGGGILFSLSAMLFNFTRGLIHQESWAVMGDFSKAPTHSVSDKQRQTMMTYRILYSPKATRFLEALATKDSAKLLGKLDGYNSEVLVGLLEGVKKDYQEITSFDTGAFDQAYANYQIGKTEPVELNLSLKWAKLTAALRNVKQWEGLPGKLVTRYGDVTKAVGELSQLKVLDSDKRKAVEAWVGQWEDELNDLGGEDADQMLPGFLYGKSRSGESYEEKISRALKIGNVAHALEARLLELGLAKEAHLKAHGIIPKEGEKGITGDEVFSRLKAHVEGGIVCFRLSQALYLTTFGALVATHLYRRPVPIFLGAASVFPTVVITEQSDINPLIQSQSVRSMPLEQVVASLFALTLVSGLLVLDERLGEAIYAIDVKRHARHAFRCDIGHFICGALLFRGLYEAGRTCSRR